MSTREKLLITLFIALALIIRLWYVSATPQGPLENDAYGYHMTAVNLLETGNLGYYSTEPNAFITPGYPLFMAAVYYVFGSEEYGLNMIRYIQAFLSTIVVYLIFSLTRKLSGYKEALIAILVATLYPPFIWANTTILTEVLFTFLLISFLFVLNNAFVQEKVMLFFFSGAILGFAALVRPTPALFIPFVILLILLKNKKLDRKVLYCSSAIVLTFVLVMSPWWARNYLLYDRFVAFSTLGGNPFLWGVHPWHQGIEETFKSLPQLTGEIELNEMWYAKANEIITHNLNTNPIGYIYWFTLGKFQYLWRSPHLDYAAFSVFTLIGTKIMHLLIVLSAWFYILRDMVVKKHLELTIFVVYLTLLHMVYHVIARYSFPLMPLMIMFSAILAVKLFRRYSNKLSLGK